MNVAISPRAKEFRPRIARFVGPRVLEHGGRAFWTRQPAGAAS